MKRYMGISKVLYKFISPNHFVNITHQKKRLRSKQIITIVETIRITCVGRSSDDNNFEVSLNNDT